VEEKKNKVLRSGNWTRKDKDREEKCKGSIRLANSQYG